MNPSCLTRKEPDYYLRQHSNCHHCYEDYSCKIPGHAEVYKIEHQGIDAFERLMAVMRYITKRLPLEPWISILEVLAKVGKQHAEVLAAEAARKEANIKLAASIIELKMIEDWTDTLASAIERKAPGYIVDDLILKVRSLTMAVESV